MLIGFFRKSYFLQYFFLIFLAGTLWISSFIQPVIMRTDYDPFLMPGYTLLQYVLGTNALISIIVAFILVLTEALLFNYILIKNELVPKNTLIPAMVYIVIMSHSKNLLYLHPVLISGLLLIIVFYNLFRVYTKEEAYSEIFNAGFLTAFASFFYFPSVFFILFIWFTFIVYRIFKWRDWLIPFTGLITPYLFLLTYFFWVDELFLAIDAYGNYFTSLTFVPLRFDLSVFDWVITASIILLFLWSFLWLIGDIQEKIISIRKRYWSIFWLLIISLVSYMVSGFHDQSHQALVIIPVSVYIAYGFSQIKRKFWIELFFGILILLIMFNNLKDVILF
jgi:hypothetical protein